MNKLGILKRTMSEGLVNIGRGKTVIPLRVRNADRSLLIRKLWDDRIRSTMHPKSTHADYVPQPKRMKDSYCEAFLPFKDDADLRADYANIFGGIRFGKVLEDLDAMAATVAYLHCEQDGMADFPMTILTAAVDRIELSGFLPAEANVRLRGMVSWVGSSSMEITLSVDREEGQSGTIIAHNH